MSLGAAACGIASFVDDGGSDQYRSKVFTQGAAGYGIGVMVDGAPPLTSEGTSPANKEEEEIDVAAVEQEIERLEAELVEVRARMKQYLKELGV